MRIPALLLLCLGAFALSPSPDAAQAPPPPVTTPMLDPAETAVDWSRKGFEAYNAGRYKEAVTAFRKALERAPTNCVCIDNLATAYRQTGQFAEAQTLLLLGQAASKDPDDIQKMAGVLAYVHRSWARKLRADGDYLGAVAHFETALKIDAVAGGQDAADDLNNLGILYQSRLKQPEKAAACYKAALTYAASPEDARPESSAPDGKGPVTADVLPDPAMTASYWHREFGEAYDSGYYQEAVTDLGKAVEIEAASQPEGTASDLQELGTVYQLNLEQMAKAAACYRRGVTFAQQAQDPKLERNLLHDLAYAYEAQKDYVKATSAFTQELALAQKAKDRAVQIRLLDHMGGIQFVRVSAYVRAAEFFEEELGLLNSENDKAARLETLHRLQSLYFLVGNYGKCADTKALLLTAQREAGDEAGAHETLKSIGAVYEKAGSYQKAVPFYEELLAQQRTEKDQVGEALSLDNLAFAYEKLKQPERALDLLGQSLVINEALGNRSKTAHALAGMGGVHANDLNQLDQGIALLMQARAMQREDHDAKAEADTLDTIGRAYTNAGQSAKGLGFCRQALALQKTVQDLAGEAETLNSIGLACVKLDQPEDAMAAFQQALPLMRGTKNQSGEIYVLTGLGSAYSQQGDYLRAVQLDRQALALNRLLKDPTTEATVLNNIAGIYRDQGDYANALQTMKQVVATFHTLGDAKNEAAVQVNLGEIYAELGQDAEAIEFYTQALAVQRGIGDQSGMVATLGNLGASAAHLRHNEEALGYYAQSLALARARNDRTGVATALTNAGIVQEDLGRAQEAVASFRQALTIFAETQNARSAAVTLNDLAVVYNHTHQAALAADTYELALLTQRRIGDRDGQAVTLGNLMILWELTQPALATWCGKNAVNIYQELRGSLQAQGEDPTGQLQKGFAASRKSVYRDLADLLIRQGRLTEARQVLRMLKQEEYFDFLARDPKSAPGLQQRLPLTPDEGEGQKRYAATPAGEPLQPLFAGLAVGLRTTHSTKTSIAHSSESGGLSETLTAMGTGTVALYTIVEPDKYRVILVTPTYQRADEYPITAKDLYRKVFAFRAALQDPTRDPRRLAQELYKIMLGPIEADLKKAHATTLLWSLDDALRYLPMSALHDGKHYLVERYAMDVFTPAGETRLVTGGAPQWRGLGLGVSQAHDDFPALPGVTQELGGILQSRPGQAGGVLPGTVLMNAGFTRRALTQALAQNRGPFPRYPVVHIASHFSLSSRDTNSFLLLGDGSHLSVAQIKTDPAFFQGVDLLTLSACNTAIDVKSTNGKEVEGFGALAQRLGARSVLASLWPVADASTPVLMREFYRLRRANPKLSKASGLRQAQMELLTGKVLASAPPSKTNRAQRAKNAGATNIDLPLFTADPKAPYAHPYYWAPFVLIGNPQ